MLYPKLSLLCKPRLCKPAEGQGLTQVMVGWVFRVFLFCFGAGTQVLSMLGKCFVTELKPSGAHSVPFHGCVGAQLPAT